MGGERLSPVTRRTRHCGMPESTEDLRRTIREAAAERNRLHEALRTTTPGTGTGEEARAYAATRRFIDRMRSPEALAALAAGEPDALEYALCFLEEHPFCPDSGFALRDIARALRRSPMPPAAAARVRTALLAIVAQPARDEMKHLRQLALAVADEEFLLALDALADAGATPASANAVALANYLTKRWDTREGSLEG